jgi:HSP20 family protein
MATRALEVFPGFWDPWRELERLESEVGRLFNGTRRGLAAEGIPVNVWADAESVTVTAELPGVAPEDVEVSVVGRRLTLRGERKTAVPGEGTRYHRRERTGGRFGRAISLPFPVEGDRVAAGLKDGVLTVTLPRAEADKPRRIEIAAA